MFNVLSKQDLTQCWKVRRQKERGIQVDILVQIMNLQSIVSRPQVEADCRKEEERKLPWMGRRPKSRGFNQYPHRQWLQQSMTEKRVTAMASESARSTLRCRHLRRGCLVRDWAGHIKETSRQVLLRAVGRRWHDTRYERGWDLLEPEPCCTAEGLRRWGEVRIDPDTRCLLLTRAGGVVSG